MRQRTLFADASSLLPPLLPCANVQIREKRKHEGEHHIKEFYDILSQVSELREEEGLVPPRPRIDTGSSLDGDMAAVGLGSGLRREYKMVCDVCDVCDVCESLAEMDTALSCLCAGQADFGGQGANRHIVN